MPQPRAPRRRVIHLCVRTKQMQKKISEIFVLTCYWYLPSTSPPGATAATTAAVAIFWISSPMAKPLSRILDNICAASSCLTGTRCPHRCFHPNPHPTAWRPAARPPSQHRPRPPPHRSGHPRLTPAPQVAAHQPSSLLLSAAVAWHVNHSNQVVFKKTKGLMPG